MLRNQISQMSEDVFTRCGDLINEISPSLQADYRHLKGQIQSEKEENDLLYREMMNLKRENQSAQKRMQLIAHAVGRLEKALGVKPKKL